MRSLAFLVALALALGTCAEYSPDGSGVRDDDNGAAHTCVERLWPRGLESDATRPSCCVVGDLMTDTTPPESLRSLSQAINSFGQFSLSHDHALTPGDRSRPPVVEECFVAFLGATGPGGDCKVNVVTAFLDLSTVYGSDNATLYALRALDGRGRLRMDENNLLPHDARCHAELGVPMDNELGAGPHELFCAGDSRANENVLLLLWHTLFAREHNRLAERVCPRVLPPSQRHSDDALFECARARNVAQYQRIVYYEYAYELLGETTWRDYAMHEPYAYDPLQKPQVTAEFSAGSFRWSRGQLAPLLGDSIAFTNIFFNPNLLIRYGVDRIADMMVSTAAGTIGPNFPSLGSAPGIPNLAALDCFRSRDFALPSLEEVVPRARPPSAPESGNFEPDTARGRAMLEAYAGADTIDFVAGLAEPHTASDSPAGAIFRHVLAQRMRGLRFGDPLWYESDRELAQFANHTTLMDIVTRNANLVGVPSHPFAMYYSYTERSCTVPPEPETGALLGIGAALFVLAGIGLWWTLAYSARRARKLV